METSPPRISTNYNLKPILKKHCGPSSKTGPHWARRRRALVLRTKSKAVVLRSLAAARDRRLAALRCALKTSTMWAVLSALCICWYYTGRRAERPSSKPMFQAKSRLRVQFAQNHNINLRTTTNTPTFVAKRLWAFGPQFCIVLLRSTNAGKNRAVIATIYGIYQHFVGSADPREYII